MQSLQNINGYILLVSENNTYLNLNVFVFKYSSLFCKEHFHEVAPTFHNVLSLLLYKGHTEHYFVKKNNSQNDCLESIWDTSVVEIVLIQMKNYSYELQMIHNQKQYPPNTHTLNSKSCCDSAFKFLLQEGFYAINPAKVKTDSCGYGNPGKVMEFRNCL